MIASRLQELIAVALRPAAGGVSCEAGCEVLWDESQLSDISGYETGGSRTPADRPAYACPMADVTRAWQRS
jgi:hypothetical protein